MSKESLQKQAARADNIADQTVDEALKETLRDAANEYREDAKETGGYALFHGDTQLAGTFPTEQDVLKAALAEGLVPEMQPAEPGGQILPPGYHIENVKHYDPQPELKKGPALKPSESGTGDRSKRTR